MSLLAGAAIFNDSGQIAYRDFVDFDKAVPMVNFPPEKTAEIVTFGGLVISQKGTQVTVVDLARIDGLNPHFDNNTMVSFSYIPKIPIKTKVTSRLRSRILLQTPPTNDPDFAAQLIAKQTKLKADMAPYNPNYAGFSFVNGLDEDYLEEYVNNFRFVTQEPDDNNIITPFYDNTTGFVHTSSLNASGIDEALYFDGGVTRVRASIYPGHQIKGYYRYLILVNSAPNEDLVVNWSGIRITRRGGLVRLKDDTVNGFVMADDVDELQAQLDEGKVETYQRISANYHALTARTVLEFELYFSVDITVNTLAIAFCTEEEAKRGHLPNNRFIDIMGNNPIGVKHNAYFPYPGETRPASKKNATRTISYMYDFSKAWDVKRVAQDEAVHVTEAWQKIRVFPWQENLAYRGPDAPRRISHVVLKAETYGGGDGSIYIGNFVLETGKPQEHR